MQSEKRADGTIEAYVIRLIREEEREKCAVLASKVGDDMSDSEGEFYIVRKIVEAIRANSRITPET